MSSRLRLSWRVALTVGTICGFLTEAVIREPWMTFFERSERGKREARTRALKRWASFLMDSLGFRVRLGPSPQIASGGALLVANHMSFWDVVAIASRIPVVFVTSVEIRETPVLGWVCRAAGCIFVERRDRERKYREREQVAQTLRDGGMVVLFPEATSTDGSGILPFKRSFFTPAIESGSPVIPMCINYDNIDGNPVDRINRDLVFYYGDQKFHTQLLRTLRLRSLDIFIAALAPISGITDREEVVRQAYDAIHSRFVPVEG